MSTTQGLEPMVEMYLFETGQLVDKLENITMTSESNNDLSSDLDEIFRIMHTIKGNSMMMMFEEIANLAHALEDLFDYLKEQSQGLDDYTTIFDLMLATVDFFKVELEKIAEGDQADGACRDLVATIKQYLESLKFMSGSTYEKPEEPAQIQYFIAPAQQETQANKKEKKLTYYKTHIRFEEGCELENVRAFSIVHGLKDLVEDQFYFPPDIVENEASAALIKKEGFLVLYAMQDSHDMVQRHFDTTAFIDALVTEEIDQTRYDQKGEVHEENLAETKAIEQESNKHLVQKNKKPKKMEAGMAQASKNFITVNLDKVNELMDLVGELVVSESMVTRNPELQNLALENFDKAARQHRFIIKEVQDVVMSMRMVPLDLTFQKMNRLVRDMNKKTNKSVEMTIAGADTEVDKNVIEHIADPLMHIIRNAIDHGIESPDERKAAGKTDLGHVHLEAKQSGGSVYIVVKDNGRGIDKAKVLDKAEQADILVKPREEYTDREINHLIFAPGFSTKEEVTEFSGRGVGMDVVSRNIEDVGGTVVIDSIQGQGTEITIKIPLTLAIIEGMMIQAGEAIFSLPITSISESIRVQQGDIIRDNQESEMVMIREECVPVVRLHDRYDIPSAQTCIDQGVLVMIENEKGKQLLFVDQIIGEQQLVVKRIPKYMQGVEGVSGCALLGDGRISLILDPASIV